MRRIFKWLGYTLAGAVILVLIALVAVRLIFGRDEPATELAQRWNTPLAIEPVADSDNAWVWLIGQGAAATESPVAFGRRRLDAYEARVRLGPAAGREDALTTLSTDPLPFAEDPLEHSLVAASCPFRDMDCIEWAERLAAPLSSLAAANAVRLDRYEQTLDLARYEEVATPSFHEHEPMPDASIRRIAHLHLDLIARDLAQGLATNVALARLSRVADFWRAAAEQDGTLLIKRMADGMLERCWRIADNLVDRLPNDQRAPAIIVSNALWREPSAAFRDIVPELRRTNRVLVESLEAMLGFRGFPAECRLSSIGHCFGIPFMRAAYAPQATRNLSAATFEEIASVWRAQPLDYDREKARSAAAILALHPFLAQGDFVDFFRHGNPTGRITLTIAIPAYAGYIEPRHDVEALRRMLVLKHLSRQRGIAPHDMPGFLAAQPVQLRHPFSGDAFEWDATLRELAYTPRATRWHRSRLSVGVGERIDDGVQDCSHPMRYHIRKRASATEVSDLVEVRGCGGLWSDGSRIDRDEDDPTDPQNWRRMSQFEHLSAASTPTMASLRLLWRDEDDRLLAYESLHLVPDGEFHSMQALGHDDGAVLEVSAMPAPETPLVRAFVRDLPLDELAAALRRVKGVRLQGVEACAGKKFTASFSAVPVEELVMLMGNECERWPRLLRAGVYRLEASSPSE